MATLTALSSFNVHPSMSVVTQANRQTKTFNNRDTLDSFKRVAAVMSETSVPVRFYTISVSSGNTLTFRWS